MCGSAQAPEGRCRLRQGGQRRQMQACSKSRTFGPQAWRGEHGAAPVASVVVEMAVTAVASVVVEMAVTVVGRA